MAGEKFGLGVGFLLLFIIGVIVFVGFVLMGIVFLLCVFSLFKLALQVIASGGQM